MLRKTIVLTFAVAVLTACATSPTGTNPLITALTRISNTGLADLQNVENVASVPNASMPGGIEDADGLACAKAAVVVLTQINTLNAAANGPGAGALTLAEMASLFQPNSPQASQALNTLTTGCIAKANDVLGAAGVIAAGGVVGLLANTNALLPLVAAP